MKKWKLLFLFPLLFAACQQEQEPVPIKPHLNHNTVSSGESIAKNLSVSVSRKAVRQYLKKELVKKFDGDYNFLIALHKQRLIEKETFFEEVLEAPESTNSLDLLLREYPLLQVAMPAVQGKTADDWDTDSEIPLVVFRPAEADLNKLSYLPAYKNGKKIMLDLTREPEERILVISNNERTIIIDDSSPSKKALPFGVEDACFDEAGAVGNFGAITYYLKNTLESCYDTGEPSGGEVECTGCDRDCFTGRDYISKAKFTTMNYMREAEHYLDGNPELYFIVTLASKNPSGFASLRKSYPSRDRSQWKDCGIFSCVPEWHEYNQPVFDWDPEIFGNLVRYDWFEEDFSTSKIDITLGLTSKFEKVSVSGNVKITISKKDYFLDQDFVNYCDRTSRGGTVYNTGKLYFTVTNP